MSFPATNDNKSAVELKVEEAFKSWLAQQTALASISANIFTRGPMQEAAVPRIEIEALELGPDPTVRRGVVHVSANVKLKCQLDDKTTAQIKTLWHAVNDSLRRTDLKNILSAAVAGFHVWFVETRPSRESVSGRTFDQVLTLFLKCQPMNA